MDEKGYVMSGLGFLLLIPVMIIIPIALSLEEQSGNLPETYVKTDTVFQCYKDIQADIISKINEFLGDPKKNNGVGTYGVVYPYDHPEQFAGNISYLYNRTQVGLYQGSFANTVDSLNIVPIFKGTDSLTITSTSGIIPLQNGIEIRYNYVNQTTVNNFILYQYSMDVAANMTMIITKNNTGVNQNFVSVYHVPNAFYVNSSTSDSAAAAARVDSFFTTANNDNNLRHLLQAYGICL